MKPLLTLKKFTPFFAWLKELFNTYAKSESFPNFNLQWLGYFLIGVLVLIIVGFLIKGFSAIWKTYRPSSSFRSTMPEVMSDTSYTEQISLALAKGHCAKASRIAWMQFLHQRKLPKSMTPLEFNTSKRHQLIEIYSAYRAMYASTITQEIFQSYSDMLERVTKHE